MRLFLVYILFIISELSAFGQSKFEMNELFIGEISDDVQVEPVYLGDSLVFYLHPNQRFVCRYVVTDHIIYQISLADGKNGIVRSDHIKRAIDQSLFKFAYPQNSFPFTKEPTIYGLSRYSNCNYLVVLAWQKYFNDSTNFVELTLRAYNKDTTAFFFLMKHPYLDSDGSGQWSFNNWKIINSYTDRELSNIILNRNRQGRREILNALYSDIVFSPFGEENSFLDLYYSKWYPLTWMLIEFEIHKTNIGGKKYSKEFKKLKKQILISSK